MNRDEYIGNYVLCLGGASGNAEIDVPRSGQQYGNRIVDEGTASAALATCKVTVFSRRPVGPTA